MTSHDPLNHFFGPLNHYLSSFDHDCSSAGFSHKDNPQTIDLNCVRLCFQVFLEGNEKGAFTFALKPVVSDPIYDKSKFLVVSHRSWMVYLISFMDIFPLTLPEPYLICSPLRLVKKTTELLSTSFLQIPSLIVWRR